MENTRESIVWLKDKDGGDHVCYIHDTIDDKKQFEQLSEDEKQHCYNEKRIWS